MSGVVKQARYEARRKATDLDAWRADKRQWQANHRARNPEKKAAWNAVYKAVRSGRLVRPESCERCGIACKPDASHDNYEHKLAVEWLCRPCHIAKDWKGI